MPEFQVIAEAATGLEAVSQAKDLQPELILMDLDLPHLNGLEAAQQICSLSPNSKILFISEDNTVETAQDAFRVGATGYIIKSDAGVELLAALQDIVAGRRYVSRRLARHKFFGVE